MMDVLTLRASEDSDVIYSESELNLCQMPLVERKLLVC